MTTAQRIMDRLPATPPETVSQRVARRLRGLLGERGISQAEFARLVETNVASMSRRLSGKYPINLDEVQMYAGVLGVTPTFLMTGSKESSPDDMERREWSRLGESNPRPIHYQDSRTSLNDDCAKVFPLAGVKRVVSQRITAA